MHVHARRPGYTMGRHTSIVDASKTPTTLREWAIITRQGACNILTYGISRQLSGITAVTAAYYQVHEETLLRIVLAGGCMHMCANVANECFAIDVVPTPGFYVVGIVAAYACHILQSAVAEEFLVFLAARHRH